MSSIEEFWVGFSAISTAALALATVLLAVLTRKLEKSWIKTSQDQVAIKVWLEFERRFDAREMMRARSELAKQIRNYSIRKHAAVSETVPNFFESVGTAYRQGFLNKKLADSSFGFYACRWWEALKAYVDHEQKRHGEDGTIFEDFKYLADNMRMSDEAIDDSEVQRFLEDEMKLDSPDSFNHGSNAASLEMA